MCSAMSGLGEGERHSPSYLMLCPSNKYLCDQMLSELLDNRLLTEALRYYIPSGEPTWRPSAPTPHSTLSCVSCAQHTSRSVNVSDSQELELFILLVLYGFVCRHEFSSDCSLLVFNSFMFFSVLRTQRTPLMANAHHCSCPPLIAIR